MFCEHLRFEQPLTAIRFDAELLRAPIVQNAETLQAFLATAPQSVFLRYKNDDSWTARLRRRLRQASIQAGETHWPLLEELAAELGTNPTTLRRRLEAEGTSYQQLKDRLRSDLAIDRLVSSQASIDELALELGFHDASAFHRAFRRWTGLPPGPTAGASRASRSGSAASGPALIEVDHLSVTQPAAGGRPATVVLQDICCQVEPGGVLTLVGPRARASPPCCAASTAWPSPAAAPSAWAARTSASWTRASCAAAPPWSCRRRCCSKARCATTCACARPATRWTWASRAWPRCCRRWGWTRPCWTATPPSSPAARSSA
jgi:AraC-like DNA-binding protein